MSGASARLYIVAAGQTVAMQTVQGSIVGTPVYLLHDNLGSAVTQVQVDSAGNWAVIQAVGYDAWGNSRNPGNGAANNATYQLPIADAQALGYTGQTNLAGLNLVHMGGRVYDPAIGRFLSADPNVPHPLFSQSYDRYAYCLNNPLSLTDPSGYFDLGSVVEVAAIIALSIVTAGAADAADAAAAGVAVDSAAAITVGAMAGGAVAGFLSTPGSLGDRLGGALAYGVMGGVGAGLGGATMITGGEPIGEMTEAAAQGLEGGLLSSAGGGRFGDGFLGGAAGVLVPVPASTVGRGIVAAVVGGTLSEISGGNFANGAYTAAFASLISSLAEDYEDPSGENEAHVGAKRLMSLSANGLAFIQGHEKLSLTEYLDQAGVETIGYGHRILPGEDFSNGITEAQARALLKSDVQIAVGEVNAALQVTLKQNQFDALVSFAFNAGPRSVLAGNEMMMAVNNGKVTQASFTAYEYIHVDGKPIVSQGLLNRRLAEYEMYSGGGL